MSEKTEKQPNYTPEQVQELTAAYLAAANELARDNVLHDFAEKFGKTVSSIRMRLVRDNVYIKKEKAKSATGKRITKADVAQQIEARFEVVFPDESIEKCTMKTLKMILALPVCGNEEESEE